VHVSRSSVGVYTYFINYRAASIAASVLLEISIALVIINLSRVEALDTSIVLKLIRGLYPRVAKNGVIFIVADVILLATNSAIDRIVV